MQTLSSAVRFLFSNHIKVAVKADLTATAGSSRDVVCVLGWGGSTQKNFARVNEYYLSRPSVHSVVTFIMPMGVPLFCRDALEASLMDHLQQQAIAAAASSSRSGSKQAGEVRSLCHVFSNNGVWVYGAIDSHMQRLGREPYFSRVIIDSAPYLVYEGKSVWEETSILSRVLTSVILQRNEYEHQIVTPLVKAIYVPYALVSRFFEALQDYVWISARFVPKFVDMNIFLRDKARVVPSLFIFSSGDKLIPLSAIKEYASEYCKRGEDPSFIRQIQFGDNVAHVAGFWKEGEAYRKEIESHFMI